MEWLQETFQQLTQYIDPKKIAAAGYAVLALVVFAETGLAVGFFLPGDSLLVVAGLFAARGDLNLFLLMIILFAAAVIGDAVGYLTGSKMGPRIFTRQQSKLFRPSHLKHAQAFFDKYGGKTIIIARFVPIVRTFAPIVAGAARMPYSRFAVFNVVGAAAWVMSMLLAGYFLGSLIADLDRHIEILVVVVVLLSLMPPAFQYLKTRRAKARAAAAAAPDIQPGPSSAGDQ